MDEGWNNYPSIAGRQLYLAGWYDGQLIAHPDERNRRLALNRAVLVGSSAPRRSTSHERTARYYAVLRRRRETASRLRAALRERPLRALSHRAVERQRPLDHRLARSSARARGAASVGDAARLRVVEHPRDPRRRAAGVARRGRASPSRRRRPSRGSRRPASRRPARRRPAPRSPPGRAPRSSDGNANTSNDASRSGTSSRAPRKLDAVAERLGERARARRAARRRRRSTKRTSGWRSSTSGAASSRSRWPFCSASRATLPTIRPSSTRVPRAKRLEVDPERDDVARGAAVARGGRSPTCRSPRAASPSRAAARAGPPTLSRRGSSGVWCVTSRRGTRASRAATSAGGKTSVTWTTRGRSARRRRRGAASDRGASRSSGYRRRTPSSANGASTGSSG